MRALSLLLLAACTPIDPPDEPAAKTEPEVAVPTARVTDDVLTWQWLFTTPTTDEGRPWPAESITIEVPGGHVKVTGHDDRGLHVARQSADAPWTTKIGDDFHNRGALAVNESAIVVAHFHHMATGAGLTKLGLGDGAIAWEVALEGAGPIAHSKYRNDVQVAILGDEVHVYGWESSGAYVEVIDLESGAQLEHAMVSQELVELPWAWQGPPEAWTRPPIVFKVAEGTRARLEDGERAWLRFEGPSIGLDAIELPHAEGQLGTGAGVVHEDTIYFAHASGISSGAFLYAIRMKDGAILWEKRLLGIGAVAHSEYMNQLQIAMRDDAVVVYGNEASGRYVEVVDRKSGTTIVSKVWKPR